MAIGDGTRNKSLVRQKFLVNRQAVVVPVHEQHNRHIVAERHRGTFDHSTTGGAVPLSDIVFRDPPIADRTNVQQTSTASRPKGEQDRRHDGDTGRDGNDNSAGRSHDCS